MTVPRRAGKKTFHILCFLFVLGWFVSACVSALSQPYMKEVASGENPDVLGFSQDEFKPVEGPGGTRAMKFKRSESGGDHNTKFPAFNGRVNLSKLDINPKEYDFLKIDVKADRGAMVVANISDYPAEGAACSWYFLDGMRGDIGWRTIWLDLRAPEELTTGERMRAGGEVGTGDPVLRIKGSINNPSRRKPVPGDHISIGKIRFIKESVHLDWDQTKAPYSWKEGEDLVYRYPLILSNKLDKSVTARLRLEPYETKHAIAVLENKQVKLEPKETRTVEARIRLPDRIAEKKPPLYAERFRVRARARGIPDSDVTIVRSSDPIYLSATVPIPEEKLTFPLMGHRTDKPDPVVNFPGDTEDVKQRVSSAEPKQLRYAVQHGGVSTYNDKWFQWLNWLRKYNGLEPWKREKDKIAQAASSYLQGVNTSAFLYDFTGKKKYLTRTKEFLMAAADLWPEVQRKYDAQKFKLVSQGLFADNTLHLAFKFGGTTRHPYNYGGKNGNDSFGRKHGVINAFDLVASDLKPDVRKKMIQQWILPMGVKIRNQYVGPGNQQCHHDYVTMYAGLVSKNWPLVSFAYSSDHGVLSNIKWAFKETGEAVEAVTRKSGYQEYTVRPILWMLELLYLRGIDHYDMNKVKAFSSSAADTYRSFLTSNRYD